MQRVSVTELKSRLSQYLRLVKRGESVEILEHSVPIARITALRSAEGGGEDDLARLLRDGVVSPARRPPDRAALARPPVPCRGDAVRALVEGRGER